MSWGSERRMILTPQLLYCGEPIPDRSALVKRDPRYKARYHGGKRKHEILGCGVHMTDGGSYLSSVGWQNRDIPDGESGRTSYNVGIEDDGNIHVSLEYDMVAWHAGKSRWSSIPSIGGSLNAHTLGVTLANKYSTAPANREGITEHTYLSLVWWLCVVPCERFGVLPAEIIGHLECSLTGKIDPWTYALSMDALRQDVDAELMRRRQSGRSNAA